MKKFLSLLLALTMLLTLCSAASADAGVFTGVGDSEIGGKGAIEVAVTVDENGAVTAIEVTKNGDTAGISDPAVAQIPGLIVEQQTANVDAVAGATKTSDAIMAAVLDAVTKAGLDTVKWSTKVETVVEKAEDVTIETEIVVIGGGGAGLAAAVQANQLGSKVLVLEKMGKVGGNTILAGGALNAVNDRSEQAIAYNDSVEWHYTQTLSGGDYQGDPLLVHTLVSNAWDGVQWLMDLGMEFQDETAGLFTVTGGLWPRAHKPVEPLGTGFFKTYMNYIDSHDNVDVMLSTRATEILVDENGKACGVVATGETGNTVTVKASKGVVVATGGFAANVELRSAYNTQWADLGDSIKSTNHAGATGDGIKMLMEAGAQIGHMKNQTQSGGFWLGIKVPEYDSTFMRNFTMAGNSWIEIDSDSKRFYDEAGSYHRQHMKYMEYGRYVDLPHERALPVSLIFDEKTREAGSIGNQWLSWPTTTEGYTWSNDNLAEIEKGWIIKADTIEELAEKIGAANLVATVEAYNKDVAAGADSAFGRAAESMVALEKGPYYAVVTVPYVWSGSSGGVRANEDGYLQREDGSVITGLSLAGEILGPSNILGKINFGGINHSMCATWGIIAAEHAAANK